jgi:hypothetical protein
MLGARFGPAPLAPGDPGADSFHMHLVIGGTASERAQALARHRHGGGRAEGPGTAHGVVVVSITQTQDGAVFSFTHTPGVAPDRIMYDAARPPAYARVPVERSTLNAPAPNVPDPPPRGA